MLVTTRHTSKLTLGCSDLTRPPITSGCFVTSDTSFTYHSSTCYMHNDRGSHGTAPAHARAVHGSSVTTASPTHPANPFAYRDAAAAQRCRRATRAHDLDAVCVQVLPELHDAGFVKHGDEGAVDASDRVRVGLHLKLQRDPSGCEGVTSTRDGCRVQAVPPRRAIRRRTINGWIHIPRRLLRVSLRELQATAGGVVLSERGRPAELCGLLRRPWRPTLHRVSAIQGAASRT